MKWFSKDTNKNECNEPVNMSPLESVTHLCASIQVADGQSDKEERMVWKEAITELFPNLNDDLPKCLLYHLGKLFFHKIES